jgi:MFS family permease
MAQRFLGEYNISKRSFLIIAILFLSILGWYLMAVPLIDRILSNLNVSHSEILAIWVTFYVSIIGSSIIGTFLSNKVGRLRFLYVWTLLGVIISFLPGLITNVTLLQAWSMCFLLGASFGLGVPLFFAYFTESTVVENRGRIGGITVLISSISAPLLVTSVSVFDLTTNSVIFALLRGMGLIVFFLKPEKQPSSQIKIDVSFVSILRERSFLLYFVAWSMFPLVDNFENLLVENFLLGWKASLLGTMGIVEPLVGGFAILIAGLLCDWIGRKKIVLTGFVALGIAYALIGFLPYFEPVWYLYFIVDGVAWGIFLLIFFVILWGDIAQSHKSEKYYIIGSIPYFISNIVPLLITQSFIEGIGFTAAFSLASFFLFVAVMPLVFAPETLPEKKMELRRLRKFAEDAKKTKEKYERKRKS